jgi:acetate---CoA ligase (ADP-forming)
LPEVIDKGVKFAVVFAAGFSEVGAEGETAQAELTALVAASGTRLLGPNTNLNAFELFFDDNPGAGVALITQSGHQGRPIFQTQELGLRLTHWAPVGNEADLELDEAEHLRMVGSIDADPDSLSIGQPVEVAFEQVDDMTLPRWRLAS